LFFFFKSAGSLTQLPSATNGIREFFGTSITAAVPLSGAVYKLTLQRETRPKRGLAFSLYLAFIDFIHHLFRNDEHAPTQIRNRQGLRCHR
jgi:hypothetical protein